MIREIFESLDSVKISSREISIIDESAKFNSLEVYHFVANFLLFKNTEAKQWFSLYEANDVTVMWSILHIGT